MLPKLPSQLLENGASVSVDKHVLHDVQMSHIFLLVVLLDRMLPLSAYGSI